MSALKTPVERYEEIHVDLFRQGYLVPVKVIEVIYRQGDADRERIMKEDLSPAPDYKANYESAGRMITGLQDEILAARADREELVACVLEMAERFEYMRDVLAPGDYVGMSQDAARQAREAIFKYESLIAKLKAEKDTL